ncbi:MAG: PilZ domain-containing protein [Desulfobacteraceae bacterium]|nr:PilZ domain-containing protein [Desulfobacteraceae bacterium]
MRNIFASKRHDFRRAHERKDYDTEIIFSHFDRIYKGVIKNISLGGALIQTYRTDELCINDFVTVSIPFTSGQKNIKRDGRIRWVDDECFAIIFI